MKKFLNSMDSGIVGTPGGWRRVCLGGCAAAAIFCGSAAVQAATETQNFDSAAAASAAGWTGLNNTTGGNSFDFSATNNTAGSPAGEAGGVMVKGSRAYYGDTSLSGGPLTFNDSIHSSGEFIVTDVGPDFETSGMTAIIGHNNSVSIANKSMMGLGINDPGSWGTGKLRVFLEVVSTIGKVASADYGGAGSAIQVASGKEYFVLDRNVAYTYTLTYDPTLGAYASGQTRLEIFQSNVSVGYVTADLTASRRAEGAVFDMFGLSNTHQTTSLSPDNWMTVYTDGLAYADLAPVPEPASLALLSAGVLLGFVRRRRVERK